MYSVDAGTKATQRGGSPAAKIAKLLLLEMVRGVGAQAKPKNRPGAICAARPLRSWVWVVITSHEAKGK
jgi:hypothetical protein